MSDGFWDSMIDGIGDFFSSDNSSSNERPGTGGYTPSVDYGSVADYGLETNPSLWDSALDTMFDVGGTVLTSVSDFANSKAGEGIIGGTIGAAGDYMQSKASNDEYYNNQEALLQMRLDADAQQAALDQEFELAMQKMELDHPTNAAGKAERTTSNLHANPVA